MCETAEDELPHSSGNERDTTEKAEKATRREGTSVLSVAICIFSMLPVFLFSYLQVVRSCTMIYICVLLCVYSLVRFLETAPRLSRNLYTGLMVS